MATLEPENSVISSRALAQGEGWRIVDVTCRAGPMDRPYEERHEWTSIAAVLGGTFTYRSFQGRALLTPGSLLLGSAGTCFECGHAHGRGDRCIAFQFRPELMEDIAGILSGVTRTGFRSARIPPVDSLLPIFAHVRAVARAPDPLRAEDLALTVATNVLALDQDATEAPASARHEGRIASAIRFMEAHYAEPLTIAGLARGVGMGRRRFATVFRQVVGVSPYNYALNLRLDAAAGRLRAEPSSVLRIALEVGFGDLSEFTRRFHARFGTPPAQFRRDIGRHLLAGIRGTIHPASAGTPASRVSPSADIAWEEPRGST